MKNTINKYIFYEFVRYFTTTLFALAAIAWTVQAVNFLDLVTEDGHAFRIYFLYSFLSLSKVLTKLIPFCFLISILLTIYKLEKDNELIVFWTSGLNKIHIVNLLFRISILVMIVQILFTSTLNPTLLNLSRSLIKNSQLDFVPSLLKEKQFNDTVEKLTIFVDKKVENSSYKNIFIRDEGKILSSVGSASSTIFAKSGYIDQEKKILVLFNGNIQKLKKNGEINIVKFKKTVLNLSGLTTKSISAPKIQETSTLAIFRCMQNLETTHNCSDSKKSLMDNKIEINKRFGMPIYIPLISLICCFLLSSRKDNAMLSYNKYIYFFISFIILAFAEIVVRYSGISYTYTMLYYLIPLLMLPVTYLILIKTFKYENLT